MTEIEQKRGYYSVTTDAGKNAKLTRVTTALDWVLGDGKSAMAYYGGKQFAKYLAEGDTVGVPEDEWEEFYTAWKSSPFDPNRTLKARGKEGTASHKLFEQMLLGEIVPGHDEERDHYFVEIDGMNMVLDSYDRAVAQLYLNHYTEAVKFNAVETEKRLYWTEHPIDDCYEDVCTHGFSGTCDVYWPMAGRIDDLKTHAPGYRFSEWVQMAMYARAAEQMTRGEWVCKSQRIVLAHEDGTSEVQDDRYVDPDVIDSFWELYKVRKAWGPK